MSEREELEQIVYDVWMQDEPRFTAGQAADAILAAGYRKPREVTTAAELDALPVGSVVLDAEGDAWQDRGYAAFNWCNTTSGMNGGLDPELLVSTYGPLTLLHEPEGER